MMKAHRQKRIFRDFYGEKRVYALSEADETRLEDLLVAKAAACASPEKSTGKILFS